MIWLHDLVHTVDEAWNGVIKQKLPQLPYLRRHEERM